MNGSRASSVGTEDFNRESAELETEFPRCVIIHPEQLVYVRLSVKKGGYLAALSESSRMSARSYGRERERATLPRLLKSRYNGDVATRSIPVPSHASGDATQRSEGLRVRQQSTLLALAAQVRVA
jgi:hypothetical protein